MRFSDLERFRFMKRDGSTYEHDGLIAYVVDEEAMFNNERLYHQGKEVQMIYHYADDYVIFVITTDGTEFSYGRPEAFPLALVRLTHETICQY